MLIAITNSSTLVKNADIETIVAAIQIQLDLHFCPAWHLVNHTIAFYADATKVPGYAWVISMIDNDASVAGALGYHEELNDKIMGFIMCQPILTNGGSVMVFDPANTSQYTVSATLSHEVLETVMDRFTNTFCDNGNGILVALEVCDPVEQVSYGQLVNGINVGLSDFVFPNYFNPSAVLPQNAPLNYLNTLTAPFTILPGGYWVQMIEGIETQIFGEMMPIWRRNTKHAAFSRSNRRNKQ